MKKLTGVKAVALAIAVSGLWGCNTPVPTEAMKNRLPQDVMVTCPLDSSEFSTWFVGGKVTENGLVQPANSVDFIHDSNCNFYRWAEQMFLWVTSPVTSGTYTMFNTVMASPEFYLVQPDTNNNGGQGRILVQGIAGDTLRATPKVSKTGPNHLPVLVDKAGRMFEIERHAAANAPLSVKNADNKTVAVHHVESGANGSHVFFDAQNKPISNPKAMIMHTSNASRIVHAFTSTSGGNVYLDGSGNIIETETGQATGDVLMAKNGSLIYYLLFVNDVYAYYQSGDSNHVLNGAQFPTTKGARDSICALARANGVTLKDSNALAVELKTSWVEAINLPDPESYIMTYAIVPTYKKVTDTTWMLAGERVAKLALIGVHVVGSAAGHPEMIWATFEHQDNSPNAAYQYVNTKGAVITVPQDTGSNWILSSNASDTNPNSSNQTWSQANDPSGVVGDTIIGKSSSMMPSNILRDNPWSSAMDSVTNAEDKSSAASNSEIISINNAVYNLLKGNDVRKNYQLIGATWTSGGAGPNGQTYGYQTEAGVAIGTNVCANSTMETFAQGPATSCFSCHNNNGSLLPSDLSHIFSNIVPIQLAKVPQVLKK